MTNQQVTTPPRAGAKPSFWYGLPVGYFSMDLDPPVEQFMELVQQLRALPEPERDAADRALRLYAGVVQLLNTNQVQECALGMHPDDAGGFTTSVFTVSTLLTPGNAKLVIAGLAGSAADGKDEGLSPLELPCGLGYLSEKLAAAPRSTQQPDLNDALPSSIWQGTVAVALPGNAELVVLQMVTPDLDSADDYRNILLGIARTLTFTDPEQAEAADSAQEPAALTGAAAVIRNDFG
ncbi:hypothetical protein QIS99_05295 [Streptomyces sp. B-S-A8]|uniref:Uncharacterized protein n=1 Tax=Streptomyces solicavernae TaxID=3043614 RepID=A0ABT6RMI3_9ACTN|nr:hypothetical protein [Streptomyces sp. B-S-A8]MDI3385634.1 hypothetical protein [Streptomyces sp. B-S-A8]